MPEHDPFRTRARRPRMRSSSALIGLSLAGAALLGGVPLAGCSQDDAYQTHVVTQVTSPEEASALTPLDRGKIRREVLAVARSGVEAWMADDLDGLEDYFGADLARQFQDQAAGYARDTKTRIRVHTATHLDILDINASGDQALAQYSFTDDSYFADQNGKALTDPTHKDTLIQFTLERQDGGWRIVRSIGATESLQ